MGAATLSIQPSSRGGPVLVASFTTEPELVDLYSSLAPATDRASASATILARNRPELMPSPSFPKAFVQFL
jgi:hypothetical protein